MRVFKNYAYSQGLSYYYGVGPGASSPVKILFLPFLESLISLLSKGPGQTGKNMDGTTFIIPSLIMAFLNDNQIAEMTAAMEIFDSEVALPDNQFPAKYLYNVAHFITMRGTVALEVLNCATQTQHKSTSETYIRVLCNDAVYPISSS